MQSQETVTGYNKREPLLLLSLAGQMCRLFEIYITALRSGSPSKTHMYSKKKRFSFRTA